MHPNEVHAIEGIGGKTNANATTLTDPDVFNPRLFHRALTNLQEYILQLNNSEHTETLTETIDTPHEYDDESNTIIPTEDTALHHVVRAIPESWDTTVVTDANDSLNGYYAVVTKICCGDGVTIWTKVFIRQHRLSEFNAEFTNPADGERDEMVTIQNMNFKIRAQKLAHTIRQLDNHITAAYTNVISTAARAFDYQATMRKPSNDKINTRKSRNLTFNQNTWADARGTSRQTITNNLSEAYNDLEEHGVDDVHGDPLPYMYNKEDTAALERITSKEDAYVVLV